MNIGLMRYSLEGDKQRSTERPKKVPTTLAIKRATHFAQCTSRDPLIGRGDGEERMGDEHKKRARETVADRGGGDALWEREKRGDSGKRQRGKEVAMERGRRGRSGSVCYEIISNVSGRANV